MNFNLALYISIIVIGVFIIYVFGIVTVHYKVFPYNELRKIKRFIFGDASTKDLNSDKIISHRSKYYLDKISFFEEHSKNVEIVMLGDSQIDHADWKDLFPSKEIANHGIRADTTDGVLDRIDLIYKTNPTKVLTMIGINDLLNGKNIGDIYKNYQKIVNELIKSNINVYIQSILLVGNKRKHLNNKVTTLNNMLEKFAHKNELITYVDLNEALSNGSCLSEEYSNDGVHLNGKGYKIWRDIISPYII